MSLFNDIKQNKVLEYFEQLSRVPRGSFNTKGIADYLCNFANSNNLKYYRDNSDNVVIYKQGTKSSEPVIIQGHTDIVCASDGEFDFVNLPIRLLRDGDTVTAHKTTLGADNGIACAMMMAILTDDLLEHPPIECVFTSNEEVGLLGAVALDCSILKGKRMLNIDSECEGVFTVGCAGGISVTGTKSCNISANVTSTYKLSVSGLDGGHSGVEIHKNKCNAIKLAFKIIDEIGNCKIVLVNGGSKENAIPCSCEVVFTATNVDKSIAQRYIQYVKSTYSDCDCKIEICDLPVATQTITESDSQGIIKALLDLPDGIRCMNKIIPDLVQTSSNIGVVSTNDNDIKFEISVRSSVSEQKYQLKNDISDILANCNFCVDIHGDYPAWEFKGQSPLKDLAVKTYEDMYGKQPVIDVIHAGLECGLFSDKIDNLDCISYGPDLFDIHTTSERTSISSVLRVYDFTIQLLKLM